MRPYAPDKNNPFPRPRDNVGGGHNGGGNNGGGNQDTIGFAPGQVQNYVAEQMAAYGGDPEKWKEHFRQVYSPVQLPDYSWEKRRGGNNHGGGRNNNGGGDPTKPGTPTTPDGGGVFTPSYPGHSRMAGPGQPMVGQPAMTPGFLTHPPQMAMQAPNMPANRGFLNAPAMGQTIQGPARLPPEIQAMMRR